MSFLLLVIMLIVIVALPEIMAFVVMLGYAISGPVWWAAKFSRQMGLKARENKKNRQGQQLPGNDK
jgi:CDP-diacylglycerol--serine O-phosphatidyltransferase